VNRDELWATVVGQPEAVGLLREATTAPVHAYMFVGPPGTGRMEAARAFAGALFAGGTTTREVLERIGTGVWQQRAFTPTWS
jgi:DNA polymerase III gamma/tau subunit